MYFPIDRIAHTTAFDGPVMDHWLEQKIAQNANAGSIHHAGGSKPLQQSDLRLSYVSPLYLSRKEHIAEIENYQTINR